MILGVGVDIIEIDRVEKVIKRTPSFIEKSFTENERRYFEKRNYKSEVIAGNFAAKEAISKTFGTGIRGFRLIDIEVLRDDLGKPVVNLSDKIHEILSEKSFKIHLSISHSDNNAIAYAVMEAIND